MKCHAVLCVVHEVIDFPHTAEDWSTESGMLIQHDVLSDQYCLQQSILYETPLHQATDSTLNQEGFSQRDLWSFPRMTVCMLGDSNIHIQSDLYKLLLFLNRIVSK